MFDPRITEHLSLLVVMSETGYVFFVGKLQELKERKMAVLAGGVRDAD